MKENRKQEARPHSFDLGPEPDELLAQVRSLNRVILFGFLSLSLALTYWSVVRAQAMSQREDNPRLVVAELRVQRGRIFDREGALLAETVGPADELIRRYPLPDIGPAVGYYSFRHGTAGVEDSLDSQLRGEEQGFWPSILRQTLHKPQVGRDIRLTLDSNLQQKANDLFGDRAGIVLVLSLPSGSVQAMVSHPGYDPNLIDERFEALVDDDNAPLLNRVTQGLYQPGMVIQPFIIAAALDQGLIRLSDAVENANVPVEINGAAVRCQTQPPPAATWADVLIHGCPGPTADLASQLGGGWLAKLLEGFGLGNAPPFILQTEPGEASPVENPALAGIGQENWTVTPLQIALAWSSLGLDGRLPAPRLIDSLQDEQGLWYSVEVTTALSSATTPASASEIRLALTGQADLVEYTALALSGPEGQGNAWYLGLAPSVSPRLAVVVLLEESDSVAASQEIGRQILLAANP